MRSVFCSMPEKVWYGPYFLKRTEDDNRLFRIDKEISYIKTRVSDIFSSTEQSSGVTSHYEMMVAKKRRTSHKSMSPYNVFSLIISYQARERSSYIISQEDNF